MSLYLNKAIIVGTLADEPRLSENGDRTVCAFTILTKKYYRGIAGSKKETSEYHPVVLFGNHGKKIFQFLKKGVQVSVEGSLRNYERDGKMIRDILVEEIKISSNDYKVGQEIRLVTSEE